MDLRTPAQARNLLELLDHEAYERLCGVVNARLEKPPTLRPATYYVEVEEFDGSPVVPRVLVALRAAGWYAMAGTGHRGTVLVLAPQTLPSSAAVVVRRRGMVAAIRSRKHGGKLQLPGGKSEPGETPEDNARRETLEEVGLRVEGLQPVLASACGGFLCTTFVDDLLTCGELVSSPEGEACWVTPEQLFAEGVYPEHTRRWAQVLQFGTPKIVVVDA
jgi:8-oxo-dGTP pyrophosphatase MutT (NUDIX family)